ncbi:MAG: DUF3817 domain-containing protein [Actinomycetales bacterium]|nr:DUF3817 domain-containing protein [Actinomycetales bacterium]
MFHTPKSLFRALAIAEAVSWTLLIGGLILRATQDWALAVTIGGAIHGFVFLAYGATSILVAVNQRWSPGPTLVAVVSAVVPYTTIPVEKWLERSGRLDGPWRLEAGEDPREKRPLDRLVRWSLNRPWVLGALIAGSVIALYVVLLILGPPGGRDH